MQFDSFSLDPRILAGVKGVGYIEPTAIQKQAIPLVLAGHDVLGLAQTGTGKTAAFMLPILQRLSQGPTGRVRALVLAPTRELAQQICDAARDLGRHTRVRAVAVYGGVGKGPQAGAIRRGAEIIVACPGRLLDLIQDRSIDLSSVEVLVLDEADRMCDMGFLPDVRRILAKLPERRQNLFFSATMPREIRELSDRMLRQPRTVKVGESAPVATVSHALYPIAHESKGRLLTELLRQVSSDRVLVFARTKHRAKKLALDLEKRGFRASALQGNMTQGNRQRAIEGFRSGRYDILVATDIAARGIDVAEITHVINFDMPDTLDAYTHRIGRTGRAERAGEALTFATAEDAPMVRSIERLVGGMQRRNLDGFPQEAPAARNGAHGAPSRHGRPQHGRPSRYRFRRNRPQRRAS